MGVLRFSMNPQEYLQTTDFSYRQQWGQFFTPPVVADFMVEWLLRKPCETLFDPAFGLGALATAAWQRNPKIRVQGMEICPKILDAWKKGEKAGFAEVCQGDYLLHWGAARDAIVCNPPYQRFQHFRNRGEVFSLFEQHLGIRLSGYTNMASAFLVKSVSELCVGGRLAYLMPLEFLNTGYGVPVKRFLTQQGKIVALGKLRCETEVFPEVMTTVGILFFEKGKRSGKTIFYNLSSLSDLSKAFRQGTAWGGLTPEKKWEPFFQNRRPATVTAGWIPLREWGTFQRGIATGANAFFTMNEEERKGRGLSRREVIPCVTKSRQMTQPVLLPEDVKRLQKANAAIFLLHPQEPLSRNMRRYLQEGEAQGIPRRFLTRHRHPWYRQERKEPAPIWIGVFSRQGYRVVRNLTNTRHLTCYHGFYPNEEGKKHIDALFLFWMSRTGRETILQQMRSYGNGLYKLEPGDLNAIWIPGKNFWKRWSPQEIAQEMTYVRQHGQLSQEAETKFND
ncbi:MAG: N-6 DNA methylase [Planctomycetia bacterium]|nr:N-6 DNA methylase [Planctomycetia bacterium]